jgi:hypothetical protein
MERWIVTYKNFLFNHVFLKKLFFILIKKYYLNIYSNKKYFKKTIHITLKII